MPCVLKDFRFDNRPSRMDACIATPFEVMQIPSGMDLFHGAVAVIKGVRSFNKITVHSAYHCKDDTACQDYIPCVQLSSRGCFHFEGAEGNMNAQMCIIRRVKNILQEKIDDHAELYYNILIF